MAASLADSFQQADDGGRSLKLQALRGTRTPADQRTGPQAAGHQTTEAARHELRNDEARAELSSSSISRVLVEVVATNGRSAAVEFRIRADTTELWYREHLAAVFDRDVLSAWLREPTDDLVVDEARLSVDWLLDTHGRIALTLPDVNAWALSPTELDTLYRRVVTDTTIATLPTAPAWAQTTHPIEQGREFSTGFGEATPDHCPPFLVEIVQSEIMDDETEPASVRRTEPRLYIGGDSYSPAQAAHLLNLLQSALTALTADAKATAVTD